MSDLQEELAVLLQNIAFATRPTKEGMLQADVATALADECLRQMAWARRVGFNSCCGRITDNDRNFPTVDTESLAPPDWKP